MKTIMTLVQAHPYVISLGGYWVTSAFIGALPAPTATSSQLYIFFFRFSNALGANVMRAWSTAVEKSPNFQQAVQKQQQQQP